MTIYVNTGHPSRPPGEVLQETRDFQRKAHATAEPHALAYRRLFPLDALAANRRRTQSGRPAEAP
jgi:hypothetical protein